MNPFATALPHEITLRRVDGNHELYWYSLTDLNFLEGDSIMLRLAIVFLVIALIAAFLGYAGVASLSWDGAKIFFVIFLVLAAVSFMIHGFRARSI
jgi:uncharacterized membrane protein YtjA (UPF0391 family)